jgi:hypothetical protein
MQVNTLLRREKMYKVIKVKQWVLPFGYGICLGKYLLVVDPKDKAKLAGRIGHEVCHYHQWKAEGSYIKWLIRYLLENISMGYQDNKYEIEARHAGKAAMLQELTLR